MKSINHPILFVGPGTLGENNISALEAYRLIKEKIPLIRIEQTDNLKPDQVLLWDKDTEIDWGKIIINQNEYDEDEEEYEYSYDEGCAP